MAMQHIIKQHVQLVLAKRERLPFKFGSVGSVSVSGAVQRQRALEIALRRIREVFYDLFALKHFHFASIPQCEAGWNAYVREAMGLYR